ncbi:MAG: hypothetical protein N2506_04345, partial [Dehalococcoidales bacterium]|nr:hypothetical protein [Dehalococcoidales bacterium]
MVDASCDVLMKRGKSLPVVTDLSFADLEALLASLGEPSYRARQLAKWVYRDLSSSYEEMSDLPQALRARLAGTLRLGSLEPVTEMTGRDGTVKVLFSLADGLTVEAALMPYLGQGRGGRYTACLSTQVGCSIGCPFCATGRQGFQRNLSGGGIVDQGLYFA